jgi:phosphoheptose isomerase
MPTVNSTVAANYLKATPSTQFSTRHLSVLNIAQTGVETNFANADSLFSKTVRAIQQTAEIYAVFTPTTDSVNIIIASDTQTNGDVKPAGGLVDTGTGYNILEAAILAGSGVAATVTAVAGFVTAPQYGA